MAQEEPLDESRQLETEPDNIEKSEELDRVTFEVLRSSFAHAADQMSTVMQRTSFSPII